MDTFYESMGRTTADLIFQAAMSMNPGTYPTFNPLKGANAYLSSLLILDETSQKVSVDAFPQLGQGYGSDPQTFVYTRLNLDTDIYSILAPEGIVFEDTDNSLTTVGQILNALNLKYGIGPEGYQVWSSDIVDQEIPTGAGEFKITLVADAQSYTYWGQFDVTIKRAAGS